MSVIIQMLSSDTMLRALIAGVAVALACGCLGVFLVLRRYAMIGEGLAHSSIAAVGVALLLGLTPLVIAVPFAAAASWLIFRLGRGTTVYGETAVGLVSAVSMAAGILFASLGGLGRDLASYLIGSISLIAPEEVWFSVLLSAAVIVVIGVFYYDFFVIAYDEDFARVSGRKTGRLNGLLAVLTGVTVVLGVRIVGAVLVTSLVIFPAVTSLRFARSFRKSLVFSGLFGAFSIVTGNVIAYLFYLPPGATIVLVNAAVFAIVLGVTALSSRRRR